MNTVSTVTGPSLNYNLQSSGKQDLGKEDFLKLLLLQMQNQDPTEPIKNEEFIAQLAQFNSLEQMQNLNTTMASMNSLQTLAGTASLIGKQITATTDGSTQSSGTVTSVNFSNGSAQVVFKDTNNNQYQVTTDKIVSVSQ